MNSAFSKLWLLVVLLILVSGGVFALQRLSTQRIDTPDGKSFQEESFAIREVEDGRIYTLDEVEIKSVENVSYGSRSFTLYYNGKEIDSNSGTQPGAPIAFRYGDRRYVIVPLYMGGAYGSTALYFYYEDAPRTFVSMGQTLWSCRYVERDQFFIREDGKLYITTLGCYSYDRRNVNTIYFEEYFLFDDDVLVKRNEDFRNEYLKKAEKFESQVNAQSSSILPLLSATVYYLLADQDQKAFTLYEQNSSWFSDWLSRNPDRQVNKLTPAQIKEELIEAINN